MLRRAARWRRRHHPHRLRPRHVEDRGTRRRRPAAIETFGDVFAGSGRPIVVTSGFLQTTGEKAAEAERPARDRLHFRAHPNRPRSRSPREDCMRASCATRAPCTGRVRRHGFVPMLAAVAREKGVSAYVGDGQNLWPSVHRLRRGARLPSRARARRVAARRIHAVAEEGVPFDGSPRRSAASSACRRCR